FRIDTDVNQFFTFAGMVIPSNDLFIGNDNPQAFQLFDGAGNLLVNQINQSAAQIWDANSEQAIAANAAFIAGSNAGDRVAENGVVEFDFSELQTYDGLDTPFYEFDADLITASTAIGRFSFSSTAVPEPGSLSLLGLAGLGIMVRRRRRES
ncbi:MAG: spondin domain-containing protein, partial [Planctomycetota bacterium]